MSLEHLYGSVPTSRPQPGDSVTVTTLSGTFIVLSFDGALFTLRSCYGATLKAGVLVVRLAVDCEDRAA